MKLRKINRLGILSDAKDYYLLMQEIEEKYFLSEFFYPNTIKEARTTMAYLSGSQCLSFKIIAEKEVVGIIFGEKNVDGLTVWVIISNEERGKGYGQKAIELYIQYARSVYGMVFFKILQGNKAAMQLMEHCKISLEDKGNGYFLYSKHI